MGYTHYWVNFSELPQETVQVLDSLLEDGYRKGIIRRESDSDKFPALSSKDVVFNGVEDKAYETFCLLSSGHDFCKTVRRPYDVYVVAVLHIVDEALPDFTWSSDGDEEDLAEGIALAKKFLK